MQIEHQFRRRCGGAVSEEGECFVLAVRKVTAVAAVSEVMVGLCERTACDAKKPAEFGRFEPAESLRDVASRRPGRL